jgi:hypothetical protein
MTQQHPKSIPIAKPRDATWRGAGGGSVCRIADISWGGCFVQALAQPAIRERTEIMARIGDRDITLNGSVVYVEAPFGFSIEFDPLTEEQITVMKELLGEPPASGA